MPTEQILPQVLDGKPGYGGRFMALIYNNDHTPFDAVIIAIIEATGCSFEEAHMETWEAHHYGKAAIHFGGQECCAAVASIVSRIGVKTEVRPEWDD